jgi:hypothetical protein
VTTGVGMMAASASADPGEDKTPETSGVECHICFLSAKVADPTIQQSTLFSRPPISIFSRWFVLKFVIYLAGYMKHNHYGVKSEMQYIFYLSFCLVF